MNTQKTAIDGLDNAYDNRVGYRWRRDDVVLPDSSLT